MASQIDRDRRTALLDAALRLFDTQGYGATTMAAVQRDAEASTGSLYHHFPSKAHLAAELQVQALTDYQSEFLAILAAAGPGDAETAVRTTVHFHLGWVAKHLGHARLLYTLHDPQVTALATSRVEAINNEFFTRIAAWYTHHLDQRRVRDIPIDVLACVWIGPAQEAARSHLSSGSPVGYMTKYADDLATAAWHAIRYAP
jgi:AcrR family transcriptional regulator